MSFSKAYGAQQQLVRISIIMLPVVLIFITLDQWPYLSDTFNRGQIFGRDAHNLWIAGRILLEEGSVKNIYDNDAFTAYQTSVTGSGIGWNAWFYPPPALFIAALVGLMPYSVAFPVYSLIGLAAFIVAVGAPYFRRPILFLLLAAPMTSFNIIMGQNGLLSAAILIGGLRLLAYRPVLAGMLFGILTFKPILGLLIPVLLFIRKDWTTFISATLTALVINTLPALFWGAEVWALFLKDASAIQQHTLHHAIGIGMLMIPSAFNSARLLGLDTTSCYLVHILFTTVALVIFWYHFVHQTHKAKQSLSPKSILIFILATAMMSPYMHNYDFSMIEGAIIFYCLNQSDRPTTPTLAFLIVTCWCVGLLSLFGNMFGAPVAPLILIACMLIASRARRPTSQRHD